jgi:hypothetical protein
MNARLVGARITRRDFIQQASISLVVASPFARAIRLRVHCVVPAARADLINGVLLGAEEAQRTASLMSASVRLLRHEATDDPGSLSQNDDLSAIVGGHDAPSVMSLAGGTRGAIALLNLSAADDGLRRSLCGAAVFHVAPSETMLSRALTETNAIQGARVAAWHPSLFRYGAEQLNDRYRARFSGTPGMSADAWCGWMAMKILAESALRSRAETNAALIAWLSSSRARFDGHKGRALVFDASGQLRQPLYVITPEGAVSSEVVPLGSREECR